MADVVWNKSGYQSHLDMLAGVTRPPIVILVEAKDDAAALAKLFNELNIPVRLHRADCIRPAGGLGARELVEEAHTLARIRGLFLFAFVDREGRLTTTGWPPTETLSGHFRDPSGIGWTRGHSIENYIMTIDAIGSGLRDQHPEPSGQAVREFEAHFDAALRLACVLTRAIMNLGLVARLRKTIHFNLVDVSAGAMVRFRWKQWRRELVRVGLASAQIAALYAEVRAGLRTVRVGGGSPVRWLSHGTMGWCTLNAVATACYLKCSADTAADGLWSDRDIGVRRAATATWARGVAAGTDEGPSDWVGQLRPID